MISCDTNILFPACDAASARHEAARVFLNGMADSADFCLCEQVLMELYVLLRNPSVCRHPLSAAEAVAVIQRFRTNPQWRVVDVIAEGQPMHRVWNWAGKEGTPYRRIFDLRLAATLQQHQVKEFATCNMKDFEGLGFDRVWNPML